MSHPHFGYVFSGGTKIVGQLKILFCMMFCTEEQVYVMFSSLEYNVGILFSSIALFFNMEHMCFLDIFHVFPRVL